MGNPGWRYCLLLVSAFAMEPADRGPAAQGEKKPMAAKLRLTLELDRNDVKAGDSVRGQIKLENLTKEPITITSYGCLRMYVDFTIKDGKGNVVSTLGRYGAAYATSPGKPVTETIPPGEYWVGNVLPSEVVTKPPLPTGEYTVQAHFAYKDIKIDSEPLRFKVGNVPGTK
jgi:hypothetical protein